MTIPDFQPNRSSANSTIDNSVENRSQKKIYRHDAPWPIYALDWSNVPTEQEAFRLAMGSFVEDSTNKLQIIGRTDKVTYDYDKFRQDYGEKDFIPLAEADSRYPVTKVLWEPWKDNKGRQSDHIMSSSDNLRLWELTENILYNQNTSSTIGSRRNRPESQMKLERRMTFVNQSEFSAPITSFDWNELDPNIIVTSSIDTTCTVWNVETCQAKTQLIAHDRDVYDVAFMHGSADVFASVGADGSVRLFDMRALNHSTIIYEAPLVPSSPSKNNFVSAISDGSQPLLRIQFNRINSNLLATFHMDSNDVQILDIRYPTVPIAELTRRHKRSVNCFGWAPHDAKHICTGGDDSQVLVWDTRSTIKTPIGENSSMERPIPHIIQDPVLAYTAESAVHSLSWSQSMPAWIAVGFGRTIQALLV
ncbi:WD40-repeat-containing domain protein [Phycomyces blakesleeanus]|uniref:WD40-repeat-containing domain protein n=1 Tax=Phycomyces blakesleeanus TaxID=4837 RepID=A0ABR3AJH9_PHYBL